MRAVHRLLPLLLLLGVLASPGAAAAAVPSYDSETMTFDVRISGTHKVDWAYTSALDRPNCSSWSVGSGRFEAAIRTAKPSRYELVEIRRDGKLTDTRWGAVRERLPTFGITQTGSWKSNYGMKMECTPCGPLSEYGPCVPDPPAEPEPTCRKRTATGVLDSTFYRRGSDVPKAVDDLGDVRGRGALLVVETRYSEDQKHAKACYPGARGPNLPLAQPAAVVVPARKLLTLGRGRSVTLKGSRPEWVRSGELQDQAECGTIENVLDMNGCGLTTLELRVRRVR